MPTFSGDAVIRFMSAIFGISLHQGKSA
jgi:hypothetical protein